MTTPCSATAFAVEQMSAITCLRAEPRSYALPPRSRQVASLDVDGQPPSPNQVGRRLSSPGLNTKTCTPTAPLAVTSLYSGRIISTMSRRDSH
ncbi:MAG TPA: hypothetical protein PK992_04910 [Planctomycetaceae bacterium]|nr:hypothetical protein [Planctomycetaceae bacterium]HRA87381.1 hypothetical protein [Planctomycetaceae bacterium]